MFKFLFKSKFVEASVNVLQVNKVSEEDQLQFGQVGNFELRSVMQQIVSLRMMLMIQESHLTMGQCAKGTNAIKIRGINPFFHFNCDVCGFTFYSKDCLKFHLNQINGFLELKHFKPIFHVNCDICDFTFRSKNISSFI